MASLNSVGDLACSARNRKKPVGMRTHYDVLGLQSLHATYDEIRKAYHRSLRASHPDKDAARVADPSKQVAERLVELSAEGDQGDVNRVVNAWKVLSDPRARENYDRSLILQQQEHDSLDLDDMDYQSGHFTHGCRCGGTYVLSAADMENGANTVQCTGCTLIVRVLYEIADENSERVEIDSSG